MNTDEFSRKVWDELKQKGYKTKSEKKRLHEGLKEYYKERIKSKYPICCKFWKGIYVQKETKKLVRRITKRNTHYSEPLKYCPECRKKL